MTRHRHCKDDQLEYKCAVFFWEVATLSCDLFNLCKGVIVGKLVFLLCPV